MENWIQIIRQIKNIVDPYITGKKNYAQLQSRILSTKAGRLASQEGRQLRGAVRNAIDVILRERTGAVISPSEFAAAMEAWGPQAGDSAATLSKKLDNLELSLRLSAGEIDPRTPEGKAETDKIASAFAQLPQSVQDKIAKKQAPKATPGVPTQEDYMAEARRRGLI